MAAIPNVATATAGDSETAVSTPRSGAVQSVARVFELLEIIADAGGDISLSDLALKSALPIPTIHRLLRTLVGVGYVRQLPSRRYALGARLIRLGEGASGQLGAVAQPVLVGLVEELGETANMAMQDGDYIVYVAQSPSPHSMRMFTEVGRRAHMHATGVGKAILSMLSDDAARGIVDRVGMPVPTRKSLGNVDALLANLSLIRNNGYALDDEEQELGVRCYAVPIPNTPTPMAVSVSGPLARVDHGFADRAIPVLRSAAMEISSRINAAA
ncbi:MAG: IclR family transcriptional regulator [Micrococcales bacterium]|nr:IclR family transcriptional regulator [Micrococcales bacterium]